MRARLAQMLRDGIDTTRAVPTLGPRPWRVLGGVLLGAACAVKWTGAWFFLAFILLSVVWDRSALRAAGCRRPFVPWLRRSVLPGAGSLLLVPIGTYLLSYLGWFMGENSWGRHWADTHSASTKLQILGVHIPWTWGWVPSPIRSLGAYTLDAYRFHTGLTSYHPYRSNPWSWLVLGRPVDFYYNGDSHACGASLCSRTILLIGTPLMWWAFVPMLLWLAWHWVTTRDWRAGAVWMAFLAGWAVWFLDVKRTMFLFYMAPLVPFLILGLTLALGTLLGPAVRRTGDALRDKRAVTRRYWGMAGLSTFLGLVAVDFIWMWPIFTGGLLKYSQWHARMWLPSWV
jgi:dolichyl-phosphate-mannose--protein O-mannosyl transferase